MNQKRRMFSRAMTTIATAVVLLAVATVTAQGQDIVTGAFEGTVVDSVTFAPLPGVSVRITNELGQIDVVVQTDSRGRLYKGLLLPGVYKLRFSAPGYVSKELTQRLRITSVGEIVPSPVTLEPEKPAPNLIQNRGGIAVAAMSNALVQVESNDNRVNLRLVISTDQVLCVFDDLPAGEYRVTATLEGYQSDQKKVTVVSGKTAPVTLNLMLTQSSARIKAQAGKYYALIIGNNAYENLEKLHTPENDAKAIDAILRERYGFETKLLLNANRGMILKALSEYRRTLGEDSNLLIYYAGHGYNDRGIGKTYWLPIGASDDSTDWVSADEIRDRLRGIPSKHVLVVSDSCYSGTLTRGADILGAPSPSMTAREHYLLNLNARKSRMLLASGGDEPVEDSGRNGHSVFANALITGLTQMDRDIFVGLDLFRDFIAQEVSGKSKQTPEYNAIRDSGHESGDFIFIRK
jgi:hypothetical protein